MPATGDDTLSVIALSAEKERGEKCTNKMCHRDELQPLLTHQAIDKQ
jgi:hypothetical protein